MDEDYKNFALQLSSGLMKLVWHPCCFLGNLGLLLCVVLVVPLRSSMDLTPGIYLWIHFGPPSPLSCMCVGSIAPYSCASLAVFVLCWVVGRRNLS